MAMTPRVNSSLLPEYKGKTVRIIGKVLKMEGETATIECSDNGQVLVKLNRDSNFTEGYFEVIGKVTGDNTISELTSYNFGENIEMGAVEKMVQMSRKITTPFTGSADDNDY